MIVRRPQAALVGFRWSMGRATHHVPWGGCAVGVVRPEEECGAPRHLTHGGEANALYRQPAKEAQGTCCGEGQGGGGGGGGGRGHTRGRARDCSAPLPVAAGRRSCGQRRAAASGVRRGMVARQQHHPGESPPSHIHRPAKANLLRERWDAMRLRRRCTSKPTRAPCGRCRNIYRRSPPRANTRSAPMEACAPCSLPPYRCASRAHTSPHVVSCTQCTSRPCLLGRGGVCR
jgi:hypothetical protein